MSLQSFGAGCYGVSNTSTNINFPIILLVAKHLYYFEAHISPPCTWLFCKLLMTKKVQFSFPDFYDVSRGVMIN